MLCEIGGTVGDIEGLPFFEAIRQFSQDKPRGQCIFMHLTLLPYLAASGELKTKPTQHSSRNCEASASHLIFLCAAPSTRSLKRARENRPFLQRAQRIRRRAHTI